MSKHASTVTHAAESSANDELEPIRLQRNKSEAGAAKSSANDEPEPTRRQRNKFEAGTTIRAAQAQGIAPTLLTIEELETLLHRSRASLYRDIQAKRLPPPIKIGERCSRWRLDLIQEAIGLKAVA